MPSLMMELSRQIIKKNTEAQGLVFLGTVDLEQSEDYQRYVDWLADGRQASMDYLNKYLDVRADPRKLLDGAQAAIVVAFSYFLEKDEAAGQKPGIAAYARFKDYHKFLKKKCEAVVEHLTTEVADENFEARVVVDTAPLMERALARKTSLGFIGKNTMFIHPELGSYLLLAEIVVNQPVELDAAELVDPKIRSSQGGCGTCRRCQVHCPTGALDEDYRLNANRCLSYWTIEHRGAIPEEYWPAIGKNYYGCDICQTVCPYNRGNEDQSKSELMKLKSLPPIDQVAMMDQRAYEQMFGGTPMTRAKLSGLRRNALIAMAVNRHHLLEEALEHVEALPDSESQGLAKQVRAFICNTRDT